MLKSQTKYTLDIMFYYDRNFKVVTKWSIPTFNVSACCLVKCNFSNIFSRPCLVKCSVGVCELQRLPSRLDGLCPTPLIYSIYGTFCLSGE